MSDTAKVIIVLIMGGTLVGIAEAISRFRIRKLDVFNAGRREGLADLERHRARFPTTAELRPLSDDDREAWQRAMERPGRIYARERLGGESLRPPPGPIETTSDLISDDVWIMDAARRASTELPRRQDSSLGNILVRYLRAETSVRNALLEIAMLSEDAEGEPK